MSYFRIQDFRFFSRLLVTILAAFAIVLSTGCDIFYVVNAKIVDSATGRPIPQAKMAVIFDDRSMNDDKVLETGDDGGILRLFNTPYTKGATLTVTKDGYATWSTHFERTPRKTITVRLEPAN